MKYRRNSGKSVFSGIDLSAGEKETSARTGQDGGSLTCLLLPFSDAISGNKDHTI